ncbi:MAG: hypothetical protein GY950_14280 [bacterium]|nr:hypothetical protein [bacterium]
MIGCMSLQKDKNLNVILKIPREKLPLSSILIFKFKEPAHAQGKGSLAAEMFHSHLLKTRKFKVVSLDTANPWGRLGETEEERLLNLLEEGKEKQFDYILVGELKEFFYGGINRTRVRMKVRIIEVTTKTTIFLAENAKEARSKDPHYPLDTKLAKKAKGPETLTEKAIKELIEKI